MPEIKVQGMNEVARDINIIAHNKGWYVDTKTGAYLDRNFGELIALMHSELSEALEEWRSPDPIIGTNNINGVYYSGKCKVHCDETVITVPIVSLEPTLDCVKPEGIGIELADCIIRCMDTMHEMGMDIEELMRIKMDYNRTRPYRHGGKKA